MHIFMPLPALSTPFSITGCVVLSVAFLQIVFFSPSYMHAYSLTIYLLPIRSLEILIPSPKYGTSVITVWQVKEEIGLKVEDKEETPKNDTERPEVEAGNI